MYVKYEPEIPTHCKYCEKLTLNVDDTCDFCWEMKHRMMLKPDIAAKILKEIQK